MDSPRQLLLARQDLRKTVWMLRSAHHKLPEASPGEDGRPGQQSPAPSVLGQQGPPSPAANQALGLRPNKAGRSGVELWQPPRVSLTVALLVKDW